MPGYSRPGLKVEQLRPYRLRPSETPSEAALCAADDLLRPGGPLMMLTQKQCLRNSLMMDSGRGYRLHFQNIIHESESIRLFDNLKIIFMCKPLFFSCHL